ncbi:MAG: hypothetical protein WBP93_14850 [Pyrinomonadaceae bacterium]
MSTIVGDAVAKVRPEYYILKDERYEYLIRHDVDGHQLLLRSVNREQVYNIILSDLHVCVFEAAVGEMLEGVFGEPRRRFGEFEPRRRPKSIFPEPERDAEPEKLRPARKNKRKTNSRFNGHSLSPYCQTHLRDKYKDGKTTGGKQKYRCPLCDRKEPAIIDLAQANKGVRRRNGGGRRGASNGAKAGGSPWRAAQAASVASKVKKNPKCVTCGERLRIYGHHKNKDGTTTTYYKCINKCSQKAEPDWRSWSGEQLEEHFRKIVKGVNSHDPQICDDIAHAMVVALLEGTRDFGELHDRRVIKKYIKSQSRHSQDKHDLLPLDAPLKRDEESGATYADQLKSTIMNPEEELMAKEARESERED